MANLERGRLSFEEFIEIQPRSEEIGSVKYSGVNFLVSGSINRDTLEPEGDMYIVAVSIDYLSYDSLGNLVDVSEALRQPNVRRLIIRGIGKYGIVTLDVATSEEGYRADRGSYIVFKTLPTCIDALPKIEPGVDGDHTNWDNVPTIHFDYNCSAENPGDVTVEPAYSLRNFTDDYNVVLNNAIDIRTNVFVRKVEDPGFIDRTNPAYRTGSVNIDFFTDLGIGKSRYTGTKNWGNYKVSSSGEFKSNMSSEMQKQISGNLSTLDPAFQPYIGFSGSIIQSGSMQEDIDAGTAVFEELKFTKYRVLEDREASEYRMGFKETERPDGGNELPELSDILYRKVPSNPNYRRLSEDIVYVADSNKLYRTSEFGEVLSIEDYVVES